MPSTTTHGITIVDRFIEMIQEEMDEQGLSVTKLAEQAGTSRPYLHRVMSGRHIPSIDWCGRIADALGLELILQKKTRRLS